MTKITLLSVVVASLLLVGCNDDKAVETPVEAVKTEVAVDASAKVEAVKTEVAVEAPKTDTLTEKATKALDSAKEIATEAKDTVTQKATEAVADAKEVVADAKESVEKKVTEAKEVVSEKVSEAKEAVAQKVTEAKDAVSKVTETKVEVPASYAACAGCHGKDGKLKALGKSAVIAGQSKEDIITKMNGYKAGTLNVMGMGSLMKGQAAKLSDANIEEIATYLSAIK